MEAPNQFVLLNIRASPALASDLGKISTLHNSCDLTSLSYLICSQHWMTDGDFY